MYSLLFVDDESYKRETISRLVDWKSLGINRLYKAENGLEAQKIIEKEDIDILLTDIEMPIIDGLELSKWVSEKYPMIEIAVITGHEKFAYAQKCISYGVKKYILKPTGIKSLQKEILEICGEMNEKRNEAKRIQELKINEDRTMFFLKDKFLYELICTPYGICENIKEKKKNFKIDFEFENNCVAIFEIDYDFNNAVDGNKLFMKYLKKMKEFVKEKHIVFPIENKYLVITLDINKLINLSLDSAQTISKKIYNYLFDIKTLLQNDTHLNITCGMSKNCNQVNNLYFSFCQAKTALGYQYTLGKNKIYDINDIKNSNNFFYFPEDLIENILHNIKFGNEKEIINSFDKISKNIFLNKKLTPDNIKMICLELLTEILKQLNVLSDISNSMWKEGFLLYSELQETKTSVTAFEKICHYSLKASLQFSKTRKSSKKIIINNAKEIVNQTYDDSSLSLSKIADSLNISTGYLSALFKQEIGETISNYITKQRIEKAMDYLQFTNLMTYEIAEKTGFSNSHYFSYAFKKYVGLSPTKFRELRSK